jgi:hypothetical protein
MPMVKRGTGEFTKLRGLITGFSNSGKTTSLLTFCDEGKSTVIISCPGEVGNRSLPEDSEIVTSYFYEGAMGVEPHSVEWSEDAIHAFNTTLSEVKKNEPDALFVDGAHNLYTHLFNKITGGEYLAGVDMNINPSTGRNDPYRSAKFYSQGHLTFGQYLADLYTCGIPLVLVTTLEDWQAAKTDGERAGSLDATRYLWPYLPGAMATNVVQRFDFRVSARLEKRCLHGSCEASAESELHHVWQFYPRNDVMGVGIKGLKVTEAMAKKPFIHQTSTALFNLLKRV